MAVTQLDFEQLAFDDMPPPQEAFSLETPDTIDSISTFLTERLPELQAAGKLLSVMELLSQHLGNARLIPTLPQSVPLSEVQARLEEDSRTFRRLTDTLSSGIAARFPALAPERGFILGQHFYTTDRFRLLRREPDGSTIVFFSLIPEHEYAQGMRPADKAAWLEFLTEATFAPQKPVRA